MAEITGIVIPNMVIKEPPAAPNKITGTVKGPTGANIAGASVIVYWQQMRGRAQLATAQTAADGTYTAAYTPPGNSGNPVYIIVTAQSTLLATPLVSAATLMAATLTINLGGAVADSSEYTTTINALQPSLGNIHLTDVVESSVNKDISFLNLETGISTSQIMDVVVAAKIEAAIAIPAPICYAFLRLNIPNAIPSDLLEASQGFTLIDSLVQQIGSLISALDATTQTQAIQTAVKKNIIAPTYTASITGTIQQIQKVQTNLVLNQPLSGKTRLVDLLSLSGLTADKQVAFTQALSSNTQPNATFWANLATTTKVLTATDVAATQRTMELGTLVKNQIPLIQALNAQFTAGTLTAVSDLAKLTETDWLNTITKAGAGAIPENITAVGTTTAAQVFAKEIYERVTRTYPTAALASRIATAKFVPDAQKAPLSTFFTNNNQLDLYTTNVEMYIEQQGVKAMTGISATDQVAVLDNVKKMQRVLRIVPHVDTAQALLGLGIHASSQIAMLGKQQFVNKVAAAGLTRMEGYKVYNLAEQRYASVLGLYGQYNRGIAGVTPKGVGDGSAAGDAITAAIKRNPSLETLFGPDDYCEVDSCSSVLSAAAYLTDLLLWLNQRVASGAYNVLLARRPDIVHINLDCPNTNTELSYIDVVNELLEDAVSPPATPVWKQTALTDAELRAAPEYINDGAYQLLANASYPHGLPFNKPLNEIRSYLKYAGLPLWQLRQNMQSINGPVPQAQSVSTAAEFFKINSRVLSLITTANFVPLAQAWNTANPVTDLKPVAAFMKAADISYEQVQELLQVKYVLAGGAPLSLTGVDDSCNTSVQTITPLDTGRLDIIHRFLRLWRHTGWQMWELDLVIRATGIGMANANSSAAIDPNAISVLFNFCQLKAATKLTVDQQLAYFEDIDTASHRLSDGSQTTALYSAIFLNTSVPQDDALSALVTTPSPATPALLSDHIGSIQAALVISANDATAIFALTNGKLTLDNISLLYRIVSLSGVVNLPVANLLNLFALIAPTPALAIPVVFGSPSATLNFIQQVQTLTQNGFTVDMLTYLLSNGTSSYGLTDANVTSYVTDVQTAMQKVHSAIFTNTIPATTVKPPLTVLQTELAQVTVFSNPVLLSNTVAIINGSYTGAQGDAAYNAAIAAIATFMPAATAQAALYFPLTAAPADPIAVQNEINTRSLNILTPLAIYLTQTQVIAAVAGDLQLATNIATLLMNTVNVPGTTSTFLAVLTDPAIIAPGFAPYTNAVTAANFPHQYAAIRLLYKIGTVVNKLHLVSSDLTWLLGNATVYGGADLKQLPVNASQPSISISALLQTILMVQMARDPVFGMAINSTQTPPPAQESLYDIISAISLGALANEAAIQSALAVITGWKLTDIQALASGLGITFNPVNNYLNPATYGRLRTLMAAVTTTNSSGSLLVSWAAPGIDSNYTSANTLANSASQALKSQYDNDTWLQIAPNITDPMRDERNAALIAYLLAQKDGSGNPKWGIDTDDLFGYFLIDVQMSSCQVTSRIVQAYCSIQLFVQRCLMNLEANVTIDATADDAWDQWEWMQRFQLWVANRKVFLYPENWLVEAQRPNSSELFEKLEQDVHQQANTVSNLEDIVLTYIDGLDGIAHLHVTGTCTDPATGTLYVVARTKADPPVYYLRSYTNNIWTAWEQIQLNIQARQVIPEMYRRNLCLFWPKILVKNEPQQQTPPAAPSSDSSPSQPAARYVEISLNFSMLRNGNWTPGQMAKSKLYDIPLIEASVAVDSMAVEALYTLKTQISGAYLFLQIFRTGQYNIGYTSSPWTVVVPTQYTKIYNVSLNSTAAIHIGRAKFDGKFEDVEVRDINVIPTMYLQNGAIRFSATYVNQSSMVSILSHALNTYGPDAEGLLPMASTDVLPNLLTEPGLVPKSGALATLPRHSGQAANLQLNFTSITAMEQNVGALLKTAPVPFRVVGPNTDLNFDPASSFFYADSRRGYFVESTSYYQIGNQWQLAPPSNLANVPYQVEYTFHRFYHPYTSLFWHELSASDFPGLYNRNLQLNPSTVDPANVDSFSFSGTYSPVSGRVSYGEDNEIIDFSTNAPYAVYNWELFYHIPLYMGQLLSQNQQFEDAQKWFSYIFNPTNPGPAPVPQRYWVPKPFNTMTTAQVQQNINQLLVLVNEKNAAADAQVAAWRNDPYNPFLIADMRPVAYMKATVMAYLDNLIAWGDNLFSTESREALNEATLLYILAAEILGPKPQPVKPPVSADRCFNDLLPTLDAFANDMVQIENVLPATSTSFSRTRRKPLPLPHTFYFKIPPNDKLLGYWDTVADRLFKLRHCENIQGGALQLALFDPPIDPGMLIAARSAGIDIGSILNDVSAPMPNYRFTVMYAQAMDFCSAVRAYGAQLLTALEKSDADQLAMLVATTQKQLLQDANQAFDWKVSQAEHQIEALNQALALSQQKYDFNHGQVYENDNENTETKINIAMITLYGTVAAGYGLAGILGGIPQFLLGASGFGGTPVVSGTEKPSIPAQEGATAIKAAISAVEKKATLSGKMGAYDRRQDNWRENEKEAQIQMEQTKIQIAAAQLALQVAQNDRDNHQTQINNLQEQIDFYTSRFSNQAMYDWMAAQLSQTYFQSYQLAYKMAKRAERCFRYELGLPQSTFISFGYWDSLHKGLLSGESLNHDLRTMQSSYLDLNVRKYEISRYISLLAVDSAALLQLLQTGKCDFKLPETLFDGDYPGHYQRRITRVSLTVVYPNPGKNDNVKCTLTLTKNSVRLTNDLGPGYNRLAAPANDPRFFDQFGAVQSIVMGNAQDDPGLFINTISANIVDQRYLPFEGAGVISSWHLEMPPQNNEIDLTTVGDVLIHVYYTALDGGDQLKQAATQAWQATLPVAGVKLFSAQNDFAASTPAGGFAPAAAQGAQPTPWQAFLTPPPTAANPTPDQTLVLNFTPLKFPNWTRGKTIIVTGITIYVLSWSGGSFILEPQAPLSTTTPPGDITLLPAATSDGLAVASGVVPLPSAGIAPGKWTFKVKASSATDWISLKSTQLGDVVVMLNFKTS